ncbi:hypothetical protein HUA78_45040 [Myxococcus sp. CA033]|uniref:hypothetical protein n=1 Tax=Myxococcus sp. CA033 TaxID=2741516 RepID=UPI00157B82B4|nr:hypothetical protein [Myxococcus sp. CA033]NTX41620.1 hypothetical protein [Myxococcus sp. CA033]
MGPPLLEERLGYPTGTDADASERAARQEDSERVYEQAVAAYESGDYASAARDFLRASEPLLQEEGAPAWDVMAYNRRVCYANAWSAWRLAGDVEQGRAALEAARGRDPVNALRIQELLGAPAE